MNNEIKLDQKATNYLKDKLGGGGSGGTYYRHYIRCVSAESGEFTFDVITAKSDSYTIDSLAQYLEDKPEIPCIELANQELYLDKVSGGFNGEVYYIETYNIGVSVSTNEGSLYDDIIPL